MGKPVGHYITEALTLSWLTGPVFDKELRVSSRRKRNYVLRAVYLVALIVVMALVWMSAVRSYEYRDYRDLAYTTQRMAEAGKAIIAFIVWFQFIATQVLSVIMLSTSISDELQQKTLGVLMTTPIRSFQIVLGKLLSKLLQIILMLLISLPLLAVVRVMGGVPWDFIVMSVGLTISCVLFVGSVSLLLSIFNRHAYMVIIETLIALGILFVLVPLGLGSLLHECFRMPERSIFGVLTWFNPYLALVFGTEYMMYAFRVISTTWQVPCLVLLASSFGLLLISSALVRRVALRQATGQPTSLGRRKKRRTAAVVAGGTVLPVYDDSDQLRTVSDPPVLWKELRNPIIRSRKWRWIASLGLVGLLGITYLFCMGFRAMRDHETHTVYTAVLIVFAALCTCLFSAGTITSEKESRSWDLLLLTSQTDWQIIVGKFLGVLRRCLPFWLLPIGHCVLFMIAGYIRSTALPLVLMISGWTLVFLAASGVYFSSRMRKTTTAVVMNLGLAVMIWAIVPLVLVCVIEMGHWQSRSAMRDTYGAVFNGNPVAQSVVTTEANTKSYYHYEPRWSGYTWREQYYWPDRKERNLRDSAQLMSVWAAVYLGAALAMLHLARTNLRKRL